MTTPIHAWLDKDYVEHQWDHAVKASFSFPQTIPKITQTHTCILVCHSISLLYLIILDMNNSVKLSHPKWVLLKLSIWGSFSRTMTPEGCIGPYKNSFSLYKQVSVRNGDHEWLKTTNAFILCDLFWKVQKSHTANRDGSFKVCGDVMQLKWSLIAVC